MGRPKFPRKKYDTPLHPWKEERIKTERELLKKYGLKNHRELWKAKTRLKRYRQQSRDLLARVGGADAQTKKETDQLLLHLTRLSILPQGSSLDDVLSLETESLLSRRLQTLVYLKGLANTPHQARQLITHGHIAVNDRKVTVPGYIVRKDEESKISYTTKSVLNESSHPARPKTDTYNGFTSTKKPQKEEKSEETTTPAEGQKPPKEAEKTTEKQKPKKEKTTEETKQKPAPEPSKEQTPKEPTKPPSKDTKESKPVEQEKPKEPTETKKETEPQKTPEKKEPKETSDKPQEAS